jgi:hypothetical protein
MRVCPSCGGYLLGPILPCFLEIFIFVMHGKRDSMTKENVTSLSCSTLTEEKVG